MAMITTVNTLQISQQLLPNCWLEISKRSHMVVASNSQSLEAILHVVGEPGGVFGVPPLLTPENLPYLEPEDSRIIADFHFWATPENQKRVVTSGSFEKLTGFTMVIPTSTSLDILEQLYNLFVEEKGYFDYYDFVPRLPEWLPRLKWAYIPLTGECDLALFVLGNGPEEIIELTCFQFQKSSMNYGKIICKDGHPYLSSGY